MNVKNFGIDFSIDSSIEGEKPFIWMKARFRYYKDLFDSNAQKSLEI